MAGGSLTDKPWAMASDVQASAAADTRDRLVGNAVGVPLIIGEGFIRAARRNAARVLRRAQLGDRG